MPLHQVLHIFWIVHVQLLSQLKDKPTVLSNPPLLDAGLGFSRLGTSMRLRAHWQCAHGWLLQAHVKCACSTRTD